ncbi:sugar phosphate isomerase/epimerase family protein [Blautia sp. HCP3S3_C12]|uniref:sugar phosphate isomerase/epimerase family protein n=1 Tax=unclassified Blautia TaxID=2648079 RepID=UPI003F888DEF
MKKITQKQIAGMNLIYSRSTLQDFLNSMNHLGIENIELWSQLQFFCEYYKSTSNTTELKNELKSRNLKLVSFIPEQCTWPYNIASSDKKIRKESCEYYIRNIDTAYRLGSKRVLLTPGWYEWDKNREDGFQYSVESLRQLIPYFKETGIIPVLEILQPGESNLMYNLTTTLQYAKCFNADELSFCIDTVPVVLANETLNDYFLALSDRIRHLHLIDGTPTGHLVLGDGTHNIKEHLQAMEQNNYQEYITLEFGSSLYYKDPEFHMRRGLEYLTQLLKEDQE